MKLKTVLSIAGSDCSGGAGIQADIKTMIANDVYAMSVITALTAQNTVGVKSISEVSADFLSEQLEAVFEDIFPDAVKIGMVSSAEHIGVIADKLRFYKAKNIVVDPVMVATSGAKLAENDAINAMTEFVFPLATVITPNIPEAEVLCGLEIKNENDMICAVKTLNKKYCCSVLLKGGHSINDANDVLCSDGSIRWFRSNRIDNPNTHGTGCTLSSAIASNLAKGYSIIDSIEKSKEYVSCAISSMLDLGSGSGPMDHGFVFRSK